MTDDHDARAARMRRWRARTGQTRTARVPLYDLGRMLESGHPDLTAALEHLVGADTALVAREVYRARIDELAAAVNGTLTVPKPATR